MEALKSQDRLCKTPPPNRDPNARTPHVHVLGRVACTSWVVAGRSATKTEGDRDTFVNPTLNPKTLNNPKQGLTCSTFERLQGWRRSWVQGVVA